MTLSANDISAKLQMAHQQLQNGQLDSAGALLDEIIRNDAEQVDALNLRGVVFDLQGDADAAVGCLIKATSIRPDHAESWNNLGLAYQSKRNREEAERSFRKALEHQSDYVEAAYNLARTLLALDKPADAESWAKRVIHSAAQVPEAHMLMGNIKSQTREYKAAIASFEKAMSLGYTLPDAPQKIAELRKLIDQAA